MFERFTEQAVKTIMLAQMESRAAGHNYVAPEQILLGLMGTEDTLSAITLKSMGLSLETLRSEVTKIIPNGTGEMAIEISFTESGKRSLELSWDEARSLGHKHIGTEHLLLALLRSKDSVVEKTLENVGVDTTRLQRHVLARIAETGAGLEPYDSPMHQG